MTRRSLRSARSRAARAVSLAPAFVRFCACAGVLALAACGGGGGTGAVPPPPVTTATPVPTATPVAVANIVHVVPPTTTDQALTTAFESHIAVTPGRPGPARLLVFLPGTSGTPAGYQSILRTAADGGAHAIGLMYPDDLALVQDCGDDAECYMPIRLQKFDGVPRSPIDTVAPPDAILNRLTKLLVFLSAQYPSEGWGAFLSGGAPAWPSIIIGGHSQGAGEAAAIAKVISVARVVQFSGTVDAVNTPQGLRPATWVGIPGVTPASAYYGFDHTGDQFFAKIVVDWTALGQDAFGPHVSVDTTSAPFGGSHDLLTSRTVIDAHTSTVVDGITPTDVNGTPVFTPVWRYMLGL